MGGILIDGIGIVAFAIVFYAFGYLSGRDKYRAINKDLHDEISRHLKEIVEQQHRLDFLQAEAEAVDQKCRRLEAQIIAQTPVVVLRPKEKKNV